MKTFVFFYIFIFLFIGATGATIQQKTITTASVGSHIETDFSVSQYRHRATNTILSVTERIDLIWETSDSLSICTEVIFSDNYNNSFVRWNTNNERVSLFNDSGIPAWEHPINNPDFEYPIDVSESGTVFAAADGTVLKLFSPDSGNPDWTLDIMHYIAGLKLNEDGSLIYLSYFNEDQNMSYVASYPAGVNVPFWENSFPGETGTLTLSEDGSTLIFTQYGGGYDNLWVMETNGGNIIFQTDEYSQNPPDMNHDGSIIVNGDYSGYLRVYRWNEEIEEYFELWRYQVNGGGTSDWIGGVAISDDGGTIACGTLTFLTGGYNGQIYLFDIAAPVPVWIFNDTGDYVIDVDLSDDGSLLAACGYGPLDNTIPDLFLFRRSSSIPVFSINTTGSLFSVDLSSEGSFCTIGGKAVHAREMGYGGNIYSVDCDLGGGAISGRVELEGLEDNSGVRVEIQNIDDYYDYTDPAGYFSINYIPAGLYTIEFSKTGYETQFYYDGIVIENELTEIPEHTLIPNSDPPLELTASQAAGITVNLCWDPPASGETQEYYIYRRRYSSVPYPTEPLGIVFADNTYSDDTALPLVEYYYVVTAVTNGNEQSPFSNEASGWISSGFITNVINVYTGSEPMIDGIIEENEWQDAFRFDASDFWGTNDNTPQPIASVTGYFKINEDQTDLYAAFENFNDTELEDHDEVALYIDDNGDRAYPPPGDNSEGNYWAAFYENGNELKYRPIYNTGEVGDVIYLQEPQVGISAVSGHLVYEFKIPIGEEDWMLNPGEDDSSTIGIFVLDDNTPDPHGFDSWWPYDNIDIFDPSGYGIINYAAAHETPLPPVNLNLEALPDDIFRLTWDQPPMNDFSHFNIYFALFDMQFELVNSSLGTVYDHHYNFYPQTSYSFYITTVNLSGSESEPSEIAEYYTADIVPTDVPPITSLLGNYPNPFNPETTIDFYIAEEEVHTEMVVYNLKGQKIAVLINDYLPAGNHKITWNSKNNCLQDTSSGIYFLRMKSGSIIVDRKLLLIK